VFHHRSSTQVYKIAVETPLQPAPMLSKQLGNSILLKREDLQVGGRWVAAARAGAALGGGGWQGTEACLAAVLASNHGPPYKSSSSASGQGRTHAAAQPPPPPSLLQPVRSFKVRGAYNKMSRLSPEQLAKGVVCSSAGNHAQVGPHGPPPPTRPLLSLPLSVALLVAAAFVARGASSSGRPGGRQPVADALCPPALRCA
jgi:hypothetical protein